MPGQENISATPRQKDWPPGSGREVPKSDKNMGKKKGRPAKCTSGEGSFAVDPLDKGEFICNTGKLVDKIQPPVKKKRGRPSKSDIKAKEEMQELSCNSSEVGSSDKENMTATVSETSVKRKLKDMCKSKPNTGRLKTDIIGKQKRMFKKKFKKSIKGRPSMEHSTSPAKSLRNRPPVDWTALRKKRKDEKLDLKDESLSPPYYSGSPEPFSPAISGQLPTYSQKSRPKAGHHSTKPNKESHREASHMSPEKKPILTLKPKSPPSFEAPVSPTFVDSDLARPSRNVVRPVRLGDQLEQAQENLAIMRLLPQSNKLDLPYDPEALKWNPEHTVNSQGSYCYCGAGGEWYNRMVCCARCNQWFHERCLAPRPLAMPVSPGDPFWLFVCARCNSGSECLKRMDLTWTELVHLALFDLTMKTDRKFHHFDKDLMPFLQSSWDTFQLKKHFTSLSSEERRNKTRENLGKERRFENGHEVGQDLKLWGLRVLAPPRRPRYQVPEVGIIQERTVLDEVTILEVKKKSSVRDFPIKLTDMNIEYKEYRPKQSDHPETGRGGLISSQVISNRKTITAREEIPKRNINSQVTNGKKGQSKSKPTKPNGQSANNKSDITVVRGKSKSSPTKPNCQVLPSKPDARTEPKPLPIEISKILHQRGYPKVAMKFASVIPPKRCDVLVALNAKETKEETKTKSSKKKKGANVDVAEKNIHILDQLIPVQQNYDGVRNPFNLGCSEVQRAARNLLCNRRLNEEDLTNVRSKLKKRKYPLCIEESRKLWKSANGYDQMEACHPGDASQLAGRVMNGEGEVRLIVKASQAESQIHTDCPNFS